MLEQPILRRTVALAAATEAARLVTADGQAPVAGGHVLGPTYTAGQAGQRIAVTALGIAQVTAAEAIAAGQAVAADAEGKAVVAAEGGTQSALIDGGAAGELDLAAIGANDTLIVVIQLSKDNAKGVEDAADLTSEFSVAAGTIDNTGGTATTGDKLLVLWSTRRVTVGRALSAAAADGDDIQLLMIPN